MHVGKKSQLLDHYGIEAIYHMTHIENVASILEHGLLSHANGRTQRDISDHAVNARRVKREPLYGQPIHSYVPFYLNPKNAMLYRRKEIQDDIVIFVFDRVLLLEKNTLFTDGNAASEASSFYADIHQLSQLSWACLKDTSWNNHQDGRRKRMAEVLVPQQVSMQRVQKICCNSFKSYYQLKALVGESIEIECNHKFYF